MCGLSAFFYNSESDLSLATESIKKINCKMQSRGPDSEGLWCGDRIILGHRRLSIQDLDSRSNQPFHSKCGRYIIVFNGELYNFKELKKNIALSEFQFRTNSDTEVLIALYSVLGEAMLPLLRGMFAFIIWDNYKKEAFIARDPYGIKPLYFSFTKYGLIFASQVKALIASNIISKEIDPAGQMTYWLTGSVSEPHTWYKDISPFLAGHCAYVKDGMLINYKCWFSLSELWRSKNEIKCSPQEAIELGANAIKESVRLHLTSDMPVGLFLSGGIDSASIAGLMIEFGLNKPKAITLHFEEYNKKDNDETPFAGRISEYFGLDHCIKTVSNNEFNADFQKIIDAMDQPSIDGINTWYASKTASELGLKVVLSGIGGDELFSGYPGFKNIPLTLKYRKLIDKTFFPLPILKILFHMLAVKKNDKRWQYFLDWSQSIEGSWLLTRGVFSPSDLQAIMNIETPNFDPKKYIKDFVGKLSSSPILAISQMESCVYLKNQLLRDSDWASMAHSVELRTPLVDSFLLQQIQPIKKYLFGKAALTNSLSKKLPHSVLHRRKTGFNTPVNNWLHNLMGKGKLGTSRTTAVSIAESYSI